MEAPLRISTSDEVFIVLAGALIIEVSGESFTIGPGEFCCFRKGTSHAIVDVSTPAAHI